MKAGFRFWRNADRCAHLFAFFAALAVFLSTASISSADIWFTQDRTQTVSPDVQDIFYSQTFIRFPTSATNTNTPLDNPALFNLSDGDNIDAIHHELREFGDSTNHFPGFVFTVDEGSRGFPATAVRAAAPRNAAEFFESNGSFLNTLVASSASVGLTNDSDVDGFFLTPLSEVDPTGFFYISLTPGSPTLAALGASPGDILAVSLTAPPVVSITAEQIGLLPSDDLDALVMLSGVDKNSDGDFDDDGEGFPFVLFSVTNNSIGQSNSGVRSQLAVDGFVGGDVYFSLGGGQNTLARDENALGMDSSDNMNGLGLASLAVPAGTPGDGILIPSGDPLTGGFTTPGGGPPGGPGGPGGGPGGPGIPCPRAGLCIRINSDDKCELTLRVELTCRAPLDIDLCVPCDDGDDSNGSELCEAMRAFETALEGLMVPMDGGPASGKDVFGDCMINGDPASGRMNVSCPPSPDLLACGCGVSGITVIRRDCDCYTQNLDPKNACINIKLKMLGDSPGGVFILQTDREGKPYFFEIAEGDQESVNESLLRSIVEMGFKADFNDERTICISKCPEGRCREVWSAGFVEGGNGSFLIGMQSCKPFTTVDFERQPNR